MYAIIRTHPGHVRDKNEDTVLAHPSGLYLIADGMGGHRAGEVASRVAAEALLEILLDAPFDPGVMIDAVIRTNQRVYEAAQADPACYGMGTTLTALWVNQDSALIAQLGDSRAYLLRDGRFLRCTRDHSIVDELLRKRAITPQQARTHPDRGVITRALGIAESARPDLFEWDRKQGDIWLLCSDGLSDMLEDVAIANALKTKQPEDAADELMTTALDHGGYDNISFILVIDDGKED